MNESLNNKNNFNKKIALQIFLAILSIIICIIIFNFSNQDGDKSEGRSRDISQKIVTILEKIQNKKYEKRELVVSKTDHIVRKCAHFFIYTVAGITLMSFFSTFNFKRKFTGVLICVFLGLIYAASDEFHQSLIPRKNSTFYRYFDRYLRCNCRKHICKICY